MSKTTIPTGGITDGTIATGDIADDAVTDAKIGTLTKIGFNATQSASTDVNTLDDYQEGTFTPTVGSITLNDKFGHYTKIGRMVYAYFSGTFYSNSNSHQYISNLPFPTVDIVGGSGGVARGYQNFDIQDGPIYYVENNSTKVSFYKDNGSSMAASDGNGKSFRGMAVYTAAS